MKTRISFWLLCLLLLVTSGGLIPSAAQDNYWPDAGWRTSTPEEQGIDSAQLAEMFDYIARRDFNIRSLLIIRNGYLVAEMYQYPHDADTLHELRSATKSFTSTLIGIAIDRGYITGVDQRVVDFFPDRTIPDDKNGLTLEHLLTMSGGFDWPGGMGEPLFYEMYDSPDWVQFMLDRPLAEEPGTRFAYNSGGSHLLSAVVQAATGQPTESFAAENLFAPLGITRWKWETDPQGIAWGCSGLSLTPRDMAKLGYLYLQKGQWDGQQIVSADWIAAATQAHIQAGPTWLSDAYGYQWWIDDKGYVMALGYTAEDIIIVPDRNLIVVTTSALASGEFEAPEWLLNDYILPAILSDDPLPPNPEEAAALEARRAAWAHPTPEPGPPLPEIAAQLSGRTIELEENSLGWTVGLFTFEPGSSEALFNLGRAVSLHIGLDEVYRVNELLPGQSMALKGRWVDDQTFEIDAQTIGVPQSHTIRVRFDGDAVRISLYERGSGTTEIISGKLGS